MAYSYTSLLLQRIAIPIVLVLAALFRPVGISFVYLLMFFVSPFIPVATQRNFKGPVTAYLIILIAQSTLLILCHIALQVTIISLKMDDIFGNCSFTEQLLRHVGFVDFRNLRPLAIVEWLVPEVVVFITSLTVYLTTKRLITRPQPDLNELENGGGIQMAANNEVVVSSDLSAESISPAETKKTGSQVTREPNFDRLIKISPLFCMAALFFAGVLRPSLPGGVYFLIFLITGTYWATIKNLGRGFALLLRCVLLVIVAHLLCVVAYQTPWMQQHLSKNTLVVRLLGLEPLVKSTCENNGDIRIIIYDTENYQVDSYFNPLVLCIAFYTLALTAKNLSKAPVSFRREIEQRPMINEPTETTPLVRSIRKTRSGTSVVSEGNSAAQQPSGSDIRLDSLNRSAAPENEVTRTSLCDQIAYGFVSIGSFIYQNSYIFTNILMMAWSIVYHGWLTFVLLLWANLLWMIPNQRKAMMRCSPFIVLYAELLLLAQYIYGMNLRNDELPSKVDISGINLNQIGLDRPQEHGVHPCVPLIVKTSFLIMFWVTLRQFLKEKKEKRRESTIADIFAPLQLTVGAAGATQTDGGKKTSIFLKKVGDIFKNLLVRLWIWLLVLVIFLCAITGSKMTGFRICYMALFLFFLLVFQSSSKAWVKIMYGFWLFLIFYVMSILILIYTYQFDKFDVYWNDYLNIPIKLQEDIGLRQYETKDLFLHLVSPTIIVILTVIQVHYFHKRFIEALQQKPIQRLASKQSLAKFQSSENIQASASQTDLKHSVLELLKIFLARLKRRVEWILRHFKDVFWRFLEIHLIKIVYITGFICSVSEVCVLHIVFVALCLMGVCSRPSVQHFISRIISLIVSIIVLTKMIYQVTYLDHHLFDRNCTTPNETVNIADWFGLTKADTENGELMNLLKPYIIYMIMVTLHAVVTLRQLQMRTLLGTINQPQLRVLFPKITRADAEKNLNKMIKYLFNYGFYKFGLEVSLIWLVSTITYRQDVMAVLYVFWLIGFLMLKRRQIARIWIVFEWFIGIGIMFEYILLVGLPPHLCIIYPWENTPYAASIQRWAMLPGSFQTNHIPKLIFDFILLMIVNCQRRVFRIEKRLSDTEINHYPGGSNRSVVKDIAKLGQVPFQNPTRDFLSSVRNYLDIFQNIVLSGFYWITLAVVFVGGTNIFDLLALGYLIGAFVFLWEGSDFYLRPINVILSRWKWLIVYNVGNIVVKTLLQIAGCIFMKELQTHACWLVHVLGISCAARPRPLIVLLSDVDEGLTTIRECPETTTEVILVWDAICFAFLILQLRIFRSHYFCHIIIDTRANNLLASRGAEIIEDLRQKQIEHRKEHDDEVLLKIKRKMEKIRATQQKMLRPIDRPTHFDEHGNPVAASRVPKRKNPKLHAEAVRAGDYYMFEDVDEKFELDIIDDHKDFLDEHEQLTESEKKLTRRKTLFDVLKDIQGAEYRRRLFMRQRSYASAPGSNFGFDKIEDEDYTLGDDTLEMWDGEVGVRTSTHSEPLALLRRTKSESLGSKRKESTSSDKARDFEKEKEKYSKDEDKPSDPLADADELDETITKEEQERREAERLAKQTEDEELTSNPIVRLLEGFLVSIVMRLNRFSRNYRYVNKILAEEKRVLKESTNLSRMGRPGAASMFNVFRRTLESSEQEDATSSSRRTSSVVNAPINEVATSQNDITQLTEITPTAQIMPPPSQLQSQQDSIQEQNLQDQSEYINDHDIMEVPLDSVDAGSENSTSSLNKPANKFLLDDTDFAARDHHIIVEVLISCWYAILSNTDLICYIVIFINQVCNASIISLPLPIMVFLWGTLSLPRPTKTFWVTLIAYTQAIVLIKCIFQYKLIWANYVNIPNKPLGWAKILGVEERANYANIDLLVLLVLFLHRFILKSHGLWKTKYSLTSDEDLKAIEGPDSELPEAETSKPVILTTSDEIEEWRDAQSNPELIDEARRGEKTDSRLSKQDDDSINQERKKGGLDQEDQYSIASDKYIAGLQRLKRAKYLSSLRKFFYNLIHRPRLPDDVYALMFLCDFINFFVLLFGFSAFSSRQTDSDDGGVQTYLAENKVPIPFLIMLLIQFLLIVIDRALYLRKALVPKIVFHFLSVIGVHIWMFFVVPAVTERSFYTLAPPIIFYIFKCFYMLLSSYQIKCGYPRRILGNFLTKGFSIANMIMLKVFMAIPFLYELRTILDWVCTDTTMTLFDWLKMEDIFTDVFFIRCSRQMEQDFPAIRAEKKALFSKLMLGGIGILLIVIFIWGPLCLFALGKTVGQSNVPYEVRVSIRIGPYDPVYDTNNRESIYSFDDSMYDEMLDVYKTNREAIAFLSGYDSSDIAAIKLAGNAPSLWQISPPDRERLLADLQSNTTLTARFTYSLTRVPPGKESLGTVGSETTLDINSTFAGRKNMIDMLKGSNSTGEVVTLPDLVPKFLKVLNAGDLSVVSLLMPPNQRYRPLVLTIRGSQNSSDLWWEIRDYCNDTFHKEYLSKLPLVDCDSGIVMYTFNDKKFPSTFSWLTAGGIFGIYTTFVLIASRAFRGFIVGQNRKIMFEDLPYVDRVLQLCLDIYLVREALEFALEEDLFAKLIFLYRSPETLIKWTRPKEELREDETDSESVPSRSSMRRLPERGERQ